MTDTITILPIEDMHARDNARPLDDELVAELAESMRVIGFSPAKPVVVRRDGGIYWVIDGGHRVAAAALAGITEIPAEVEDTDDAGVLTREGAFNLQRPDTEEERWARAQQFFSLGEAATPQAIAVATGIEADAQPRIRRVLAKLADDTAAEDLTLDQALAAHDFLDDDEAFTAIMNAGMGWRAMQSEITRKRRLDEAEAAARALVTAAGVEIITDVDHDVHHYITTDGDAPEGAKWARINRSYTNVFIQWYGDEVEDEGDAQATAEREARDAFLAALNEATHRREAFMAERLDAPERFAGETLKALAHKLWEDGAAAEAENLGDGTPFGLLEGTVVRMTASVLADLNDNSYNYLRNPKGYYSCQYGAETVELFDALETEGYEITEVEAEALAELKEALAGDSE